VTEVHGVFLAIQCCEHLNRALGLPIMDTAFAIVRRYTNGRPIFQPDKGHLHHRLLAMGMTQRQAVLLMYIISAILGIAAVLLTEVGGYYAAIIIALIITAVVFGAVSLPSYWQLSTSPQPIYQDKDLHKQSAQYQH
jgi:hypothetical protein